MLLKKWSFILFCFFLIFSLEKLNGQSVYVDLRSIYDNLDNNDSSALPYIKKYIQKAQQEKNYTELKNAYEDYSSYSPNDADRIKYADSAIIAAKKTKSQELIKIML